MMEPEEKLLKHGVLDADIHLPLPFLPVEGSRRPEVDPFVLRKDSQRAHPVDRRRKFKVRRRLAVRLVDGAL
ncbi:hypothetical protein [Pseudooceanicola sp.]|uniref:hypothetical protein n=1 Tax=Pseudooceanicola sp. TaxID=1914328 RepID=UPI0035189CE9